MGCNSSTENQKETSSNVTRDNSKLETGKTSQGTRNNKKENLNSIDNGKSGTIQNDMGNINSKSEIKNQADGKSVLVDTRNNEQISDKNKVCDINSEGENRGEDKITGDQRSNISVSGTKSSGENTVEGNERLTTGNINGSDQYLPTEEAGLLLKKTDITGSHGTNELSTESRDTNHSNNEEIIEGLEDTDASYIKSKAPKADDSELNENTFDKINNHVQVASYVGSGEKKKVNGNTSTVASYMKSDKSKDESVIDTNRATVSQHTSKAAKLVTNKVQEEKTTQDEARTDKKLSISDGYTDKSIEVADELEYPDDDMSGPAPNLVKATDIMPRAEDLQVLADQVRKSPIALKPTLASLVKRLTKPAKSDLEKIWAFYRWIVINIKYDVDGFFGDAPKKPTDAVSVLKNGETVCEGYTNLVLAFCEKANIEAKTISGFAKPYGYTIGEDVSKSEGCQHEWNAVSINKNWFLLDCTWGAGFVKRKEKQYVRWPNDFYFFTDPDVFISNHFPMMANDNDKSCKWQLLEMPITLEMFIQRVDMDQPGKEWGIQTHHHPYAVIDVQNEAEIMIQESHTPMLDYLVHMRNEDFQLMDQFTFAYKPDSKSFMVHVRPPATGEYICQIYGRRIIDGSDAHRQPLVLYKLNCTEVYDRPREFPKSNTTFGPVPNIKSFGISHTGKVLYKAEFGEVTILLNPMAEVYFIPKLYIGETEFDYLLEHCIVQYSEDFRHVTVSLRLPYEGFFRVTLFGKQRQIADDDDKNGAKVETETRTSSAQIYNVKFRRPQSKEQKKPEDELKPFVSYLIDNRQASDKDPFPSALPAALKFKCCLLQPTDKHVKTEREIKVCLRSLFLERVKAGNDLIPKVDETTFAGTTVTTKADSNFIIYGSDSKDGDDFVEVYKCTVAE